MPKRLDPALRFWPKVEKTKDCWVWTGATASSGHGRFRGANGQLMAAHRFVWEAENGPVPRGLVLCHRCDNPPCVRPDHLFLGTQSDNLSDMRAKGRAATGTRHHSSRLTEAQVIAMREQYATGGYRLIDLGRKYGVTFGTVSLIVRGRYYATIGGPIANNNAHLGRHLSEALLRSRRAA